MSVEPTPILTPAEWNALSKTDLWSGPFGDPGHCHNLLDEWAERVEQLEAALREFEWRWNDDAITAAEFELWAMTEYHDIVFAALDGEGTPQK